MSRSSSESSDVRPGQDERGFINRFGEIPVVKTAVSQASSIYNKAKEANIMTKISLSFAEMSIKAAVESAKFAYNVVPTPGIVGTLKEEAEKKVGQADALACKGLDFLEEKYPAIMSEPQEILSAGKDKIEKSEIIEAALIVGEAAADYINPAGTKKKMNGNEKPRVVSNRTLDRIVDVSRRTGMGLYRGGSKFFWNTAAAPWYATKTSLNLACRAAVGTAELTRDVISYLPDFSALLPRRRKARKTDRSRIQRRTETDQSSLAVSPDKKRKRSNGDNNSDDDTLYEMLYVKEYSSSDEDPDYCPKESDNDDESSDTVGPSDEEGDSGDSGEGDEADISEAGGQALTADQVKRSVKFDGGRIVHGPQGSLVVHVTERTPSIATKIYLAEKEAHKANQMSGVQQKVIKDDDSAALVAQQGTIHGGVVASEKAKGEKSIKSPEIKKVKSPKSQTKMPLSGTKKESVPSSPREKIAGAGSASKSGEKMKTKKSPSNKDTQVSNKEGAKNDVPTNDSNVSQKDDPSRMKGRIIV